MCFGRLPYTSADNIQEEFEDIDLLRAEISTWSGFQDERKERPELPNQLYNFLKRLLAIDPAERPSANDILHAIRTEKGLDNPPRTRNGSSSGLAGRIIQSMDSPMPPGTPVNGTLTSRKTLDLELTEIEPTKRSRPYVEDPSTSEIPSPNNSPSHQLTLESAFGLPNQTHPATLIKPTINTPLLMPPPSTPYSRLQHRVALIEHHTRSWARHNRHSLYLATRLFIFAVKVTTITKPCGSVATREAVWWPLMSLAALELALGNKLRWRYVIIFASVHALLLGWVLMFSTAGLCVVERKSVLTTEHWNVED